VRRSSIAEPSEQVALFNALALAYNLIMDA
jgi:hypothetical protein